MNTLAGVKGPGVKSFAPGDKVFALAGKTHAQLRVVKAADLARIPEGMHVQETAALPLVTLTGGQLISVGIGVKQEDTVLVPGAAGIVGRRGVLGLSQKNASAGDGEIDGAYSTYVMIRGSVCQLAFSDDACHHASSLAAYADFPNLRSPNL